ncbi:Permease of the drug/metabolite transporter (DMT) superfamily [Vibrio chagasii]|nr:Permease of the drug/metabolite transporter (DMT) superfamily [Vibrio chagasii]CAH6809636.1 Permease of the drug/metabolite transporter (DMT) superfamily [Vibrio chagasii]CAH6932283.1 Permease of the drug/metabolite transporter (DMT) superfamily [Vibrio chagasii]CAH6979786.1 Permease of the drug/metabolite transporter (DMT) superfamily [Vibrio chagasii]CAH6992879.1 Permease of the drug/metabolite transporter (DMT) superfamily [Vibrio chagasii]
MEFSAIIIVIISALLHAGWNVLGKSNQGSGSSFFLASGFAAAAILTPYLIWYVDNVGFANISLPFWQLVLLSGICQIIYLIGLGIAYKQADIGVIYPMARALPVLMVGLGTVLIGYDLSVNQWVGFALITLGCLFVPLKQFSELRPKAYLNLGVLWALIAAIGTTGYSIIDKEALLLLEPLSTSNITNKHTAIFYLGIQFWAIVIPLSIWLLVTNQRVEFNNAWILRKKATVAGIMMASTYGLVLFAMTMTENVSLVVALRQVSIIFGVVMGIYFLKEKWHMTRGVGVVLILIGLVTSLI